MPGGHRPAPVAWKATAEEASDPDGSASGAAALLEGRLFGRERLDDLSVCPTGLLAPLARGASTRSMPSLLGRALPGEPVSSASSHSSPLGSRGERSSSDAEVPAGPSAVAWSLLARAAALLPPACSWCEDTCQSYPLPQLTVL